MRRALLLGAIVSTACQPLAEPAEPPPERVTLLARVARREHIPARRELAGLTLQVLEGSWGRSDRLHLVFFPDSGQLWGEGVEEPVPGLSDLEPGDRCRLVYEGARLVEATAIRR